MYRPHRCRRRRRAVIAAITFMNILVSLPRYAVVVGLWKGHCVVLAYRRRYSAVARLQN